MTNKVPYSQLPNFQRKNLEDLLPLPMPLSFQIEPTNVCNFRCGGCPHTLPDYKQIVGYYQHMEMPLFEKIIKDIQEMGRAKTIKLYNYGESTLHPNLGEMIRSSKTVADRVELTSNGTQLTDKLNMEFITHKLDYLRFSIYGVTQATNENFTKTKIGVDKIYSNILRLRDTRNSMGSIYPFIYVKMFETTSQEEVEIFKKLYEGIADEVGIEYVHNLSGYDNIEQKISIKIPKHTPKKICPAPFYQTVVGANGDVTICCADWTFSSKVGNLKEQSLSEIWNGKNLRKLQQLLLEGRAGEIESCKNCTWNWSHPDNIDNISDEIKGRFYK